MSWLDKFFKAYSSVQVGGVALAPETTINFVGATVVDDPTNARTTVTVTGGGGGVPVGVCTLEQFGALGNGTTDDSAALASALTAIGAGTYRVLSLGPKTYLVNSGGDIPAGATIVGQGVNSVLKSATGAVAILRIGAVNDITLRDFQLLGSSTGTTESTGLKMGVYGVAGSGPDRVFV